MKAMTIPQILRKWSRDSRSRKTQKDLAEAVKVSCSAVTQWKEKGRVGGNSYRAVATLIGVDPVLLRPDLLGEDEAAA